MKISVWQRKKTNGSLNKYPFKFNGKERERDTHFRLKFIIKSNNFSDDSTNKRRKRATTTKMSNRFQCRIVSNVRYLDYNDFAYLFMAKYILLYFFAPWNDCFVWHPSDKIPIHHWKYPESIIVFAFELRTCIGCFMTLFCFFLRFFFRFCKLASEGDRKRRRRVKSCAITTLSPLSPTNTQKCVRWNFFDWFLNAVSFSAIIEWVNLSNILMSIEIKWRFLIREREKRLRQIILLNDMIIYQFCSIIITNQTIKIKYLTQLNS